MDTKLNNIKQSQELSVRKFYENFKELTELELLAGGDGFDRIILEPSLNRPALAITGYFKNFASKRIQLFGAGEMAYMRDLSEKSQRDVLFRMAELKIPCIVISRNLAPTKAMVDVANECKVPLFRTKMKSKEFLADIIVRIDRMFSPKTSEHGTLIDIRGVGTLICGDSGIGKSECALALIDKGHSLVADDVVYCEKVNDHKVLGKAPELNRGYMECRGIGIISVAELFGINCVRMEKSIDIIVSFVEWKSGMVEDRTGLDTKYKNILGVQIPHFEIPVRPGRDMARLVEVAARVYALRQMGHDSAKAFNDKLIAHMAKKD
ncbi:MAG: HPr(Ser) kinase/phosphatase [Verrucomicrobiaceae bacterium]|nr:HPr(Ser) kinase/phosphatase [Verrucomicrobiaceae bacterium]